MALTLQWRGKVHGVPRGALVRGNWATIDGGIVGGNTQRPYGIVMDDAPTTNPPTMVDLYGEGSVIRDTTLTLTETSIVYSDGAGGVTTTKPAAGGWQVGLPVGTDSYVVAVDKVEA